MKRHVAALRRAGRSRSTMIRAFKRDAAAVREFRRQALQEVELLTEEAIEQFVNQ